MVKSMFLVNECYGPVIQGEGPSTGRRCVFLRLANCNLACKWCDTPYTWNWIGTKHTHPEKYDRTKEVHKIPNEEVLTKIITLNNTLRLFDWSDERSYTDRYVIAEDMLVISGGEPMLQQRNLIWLIHKLKLRGWWVEIETNGTIPIRPLFLDEIDQINCSPKLENSGDPIHKRIVPDVLRSYVASEKTIFKFVIGARKDVYELDDLIKIFEIPYKRVWLMPLGKTREELTQTTQMTKALCEGFGFNFSPRKHIELWGSKRGV